MLTEERRRHILEMVHRDGKVHASHLRELFEVSEDTIRRDLREMETAGLLQRVHGGALPSLPPIERYSIRQHQAVETKAEIAQAAIKLVHDDQVIVLDGGTTPLQVAQHLPRTLHATAVTHSPSIALVLAEHPTVDVIFIGGKLYKHSLTMIGATTVEGYRQLRADICFLGICSVHPEIGLSTIDFEEAAVKRAMIASAAEVVALTSGEKLDTVSPYVICPIRELSHLVTERSVPSERLIPYQQLGITIIQE